MNRKTIKIAFFDIDGTLTDSNKNVLPSTINCLNKASELGIKLALCSGRSHEYMYKYSKYFKNIDYLISSNGARIYDLKNKKNIFIDTSNNCDVINLWNYCNKNKLSITITSDTNAYLNSYANISNEDIYMKKINNINEILDKNIYQSIIVSDNLNSLINLEKYLDEQKNIKLINYSFSYLKKEITNYYFFDIVNKNVSKGNAINQLLSHLNLKKEDTICFGDSVNDLDMFKSCGISVAMDNAIEAIKKESDFITDSNDDNGISNFFDKYIFSD